MLISRGYSLLRTLNRCPKPAPLRKSHDFNYRSPGAPPSRNTLLVADVVQGVAWWWVLWHIWTEPDHILGEFEYPDPRKWTDEELGIPPE